MTITRTPVIDLPKLDPTPFALCTAAGDRLIITGAIEASTSVPNTVTVPSQLGILHLPAGSDQSVLVVDSAEDLNDPAVLNLGQPIPVNEHGFFRDEAAERLFLQQHPYQDEDDALIHRALLPAGDRTLTYGYDLDRDTVHVYTFGDQIVARRYTRVYHEASGAYVSRTASVHAGASLPASVLRPSKRAYPDSTNPEFAHLMASVGVRLSLTNFRRDHRELPELLDPR